MKKLHAILARSIIAVFILAIFIPLIWSLPGVHNINTRRFEDMEKRSPNDYPALPGTFEETARFPEAFEEAFNDRFGFRRDLITAYKLFMYKLFNVSTNTGNVVIGRDGWLFLGNDYFETFNRHAGHTPPTAQEADRVVRAEQLKQRWLMRRGIAYLFAVAPDKYSIFPEYLPDYVRSTEHDVLLDLVVQRAKELNLPFLDLRPALLEAKARYGELAYTRTDSHWSTLGAFYAYKSIVEKLAELTGPLKSLSLEDMEQSIGPAYNLEGLLGLRKHYKMRDVAIKLKLDHDSPAMTARSFTGQPRSWNPAQEVHYREMLYLENPTALNAEAVFMLRDSFANRLSPLLNQTFARMAYAHYNREELVGNIVDYLLAFKPQMVLHEMVEVNLAGVDGVYSPWENAAVTAPEAELLWPGLGPELPPANPSATGQPVWEATLPAIRTASLLLKVELESNRPARLRGSNSNGCILSMPIPGSGTYYLELPGDTTKIRLAFTEEPGASRILSVSLKPMSETALRELYRPAPASALRTQ